MQIVKEHSFQTPQVPNLPSHHNWMMYSPRITLIQITTECNRSHFLVVNYHLSLRNSSCEFPITRIPQTNQSKARNPKNKKNNKNWGCESRPTDLREGNCGNDSIDGGQAGVDDEQRQWRAIAALYSVQHHLPFQRRSRIKQTKRTNKKKPPFLR